MNDLMHDFGQLHIGIRLTIIAILLMLKGRIDAGGDLKPVACFYWFLGGILGVIMLSSCVGGHFLFLGRFYLPVADLVLIGGTYGLWRFRPTNRH